MLLDFCQMIYRKDTTDTIAALTDALMMTVVPTISSIQMKQINVLNVSALGSGNKVAQKQNVKLRIYGEVQYVELNI